MFYVPRPGGRDHSPRRFGSRSWKWIRERSCTGSTGALSIVLVSFPSLFSLAQQGAERQFFYVSGLVGRWRYHLILTSEWLSPRSLSTTEFHLLFFLRRWDFKTSMLSNRHIQGDLRLQKYRTGLLFETTASTLLPRKLRSQSLVVLLI